jgi:glycosyltransferase involved in cell wall biosynthesis
LADPPPFLLDATRLIWRRWKGRLPTGIDRVALAYLDHFGPLSQAVIQHDRFRRILTPKASQELFELLRSPGEVFKARLLAGFFKNLAGLDDRGHGRFYLNVGHTGLNAAGFRQWARNADVRPVYLVHDLIPITHPQFARAGEDMRHRERILTVLATATGIVANSQFTLNGIAKFAAAQNIRMPPAVTAWLGTDPLPPPHLSDLPGRPTFVTLGTIEARKNHLLLLNIWSRMAKRLRDEAPRLLIIGQRGWQANEVFELLDRDETLRGHVVELSRCSDQELANHLRSARALLFPSLVEGYGLPLVEALAAGVPAIASDLAVFRELCGGIPTFIDPNDETGWEAAIVDYAQPKSATRAAQIERMRGFAAPTWSDHFTTVERWLRAWG